MDVFEEAKQTVRELKASLNEILRQTFQQNSDVIKRIQTDEQLFEGKDAKGSFIRPVYTPFTVRIKKSKGQVTSRVTLEDTGKFYDTLKVIAGENHVEIIGSVDYFDDLVKKYGSQILGIQEELLKGFTFEYVFPNIKQSFNDKLAKS